MIVIWVYSSIVVLCLGLVPSLLPKIFGGISKEYRDYYSRLFLFVSTIGLLKMAFGLSLDVFGYLLWGMVVFCIGLTWRESRACSPLKWIAWLQITFGVIANISYFSKSMFAFLAH